MKPRFVVIAPINDLDEFGRLADIARELSGDFDVRVVVNHLAHRNYRETAWADDPYLQYAYNIPCLFQLTAPKELADLLDTGFIEENRALAKRKLALIEKRGLRGAFFVNEPHYLHENVYARFPEWRGPRVDHPRRSRHPIFAPCFHQQAVQEIYRRAVESVVRDFPAVDTWLTKTNDCASGFCWAEKLYNRPNGPSACAGGAPSGMAAYAKALLEGSRAAGVEAFNLFESGVFPAERILARAVMPPGAAISPDDGGSPRVMGMGSISYRTAPVRYLADPVRVVDAGIKAAAIEGPAVITANLGQHYYTDCADLDTVRMEFGLFAEARKKRPEGRIEKLEFIRDFMAKRCGAEGKELFEGYMLLHDAFGALAVVDRGLAETNIYGALSTRWLTRPFVPFQEELRPDEESYWMKHIFNPAGVEARRNLLDVHGGLITGAADRGYEWDLRRSFFAKVIAGFEKAASQLEKSASARAKAIARAARLFACVWRNCRNAIEFGLLRARAAEKPMIVPPEGTQGDEDRARMYDVMRDEIDAMTSFLGTLGDSDPERVLTVAADARDEDTFTLGADIREQLRMKVRIMLERWKDVDRLYVAPHL